MFFSRQHFSFLYLNFSTCWWENDWPIHDTVINWTYISSGVMAVRTGPLVTQYSNMLTETHLEIASSVISHSQTSQRRNNSKKFWRYSITHLRSTSSTWSPNRTNNCSVHMDRLSPHPLRYVTLPGRHTCLYLANLLSFCPPTCSYGQG